MPISTLSASPRTPSTNGAAAAAVPPLDDVKLQFAMEEIRKRFSSISASEMLHVLYILLKDQRILECEKEISSARVDAETPLDVNLEQNGSAEHARKVSGVRFQQQASMNSSVTASELSPRDWGSMNFEQAAFTNVASARLSREWKSTIVFILDNARQFRQSDDENLTVKDLVRVSIAEWFKSSGAAASHPHRGLPNCHTRADQKAWLTAMTKMCRLSENACYQKYELQYAQLRNEAENDNEEGGAAAVAGVVRDDDSVMSPPSAVARRSAHRSTTTTTASTTVDIPPFSLVIQCAGPPRRSSSDAAPTSGTSETYDDDVQQDYESSTSLVVGCEWFQWVFLVQCPVACRSEPYPQLPDSCTAAEAAAIEAAQAKWQRRHCTVQLLYPSEAGFSASPDSGSDLHSADAEYELSEPQVVLSSLLGVAMRAWCQSHPHLVAEVFQLDEDIYPQTLYEGASFWSVWPTRDLAAWQQCETSGSSDAMPIPLLPGECFAHDSDEEDDDENSENED